MRGVAAGSENKAGDSTPMNVRHVAIVTAVLAAALIAASCDRGGGSDEGAGPAASATVIAPPAAGATAAPGEVVVPQIRPAEGMTTVEIAHKLAPSIVRVQVGVASIDVFGRVIPQDGVGTGVVVDSAGYVVTNNHVITAGSGTVVSDDINVTLFDQRTVPATVVGHDQATDLAVLKIDVPGLVAVPFAAADSLQVGQEVVAIGFALDLEGAPTVTRGVISAKNRTIQEVPYTIPDAIQTDASINPGNSGGPLVNGFGEIVGINTAIIRGAQNIGFSIAVGLVQPTVRELIEKGEVERAYMGVGSVDLNEYIARNFELPVDKGIVLTIVEQGGPAAAAGLRTNDVIVALEGKAITNNGELLAILAGHLPGDALLVEYYRGPEKLTTTVLLSARPE
jgi:S1-C subfamily serine protease